MGKPGGSPEPLPRPNVCTCELKLSERESGCSPWKSCSVDVPLEFSQRGRSKPEVQQNQGHCWDASQKQLGQEGVEGEGADNEGGSAEGLFERRGGDENGRLMLRGSDVY